MALCRVQGSREIIQRNDVYGLTGFYIDQTKWNYRILECGFTVDDIWYAMPVETFPNLQKAVLKLKRL